MEKTVDGNDVFGYARWLDCQVSIRPKSPVYGFYFYMDKRRELVPDDVNFTYNPYNISTLAQDIKGIPKTCKYFKSDQTLQDWELSMEFYLTLDQNPGFSQQIFQNCVNLHNEARKLFNDIDENKNGTIEVKELFNLLELDEDSDKTEAEKSLKLISEDQVNFNRFRNWYLQRSWYQNLLDYKIESRMEKFAIAEKVSKILKACEEEVQNMEYEEKKKKFVSKFEIASSSQSDPGMQMVFTTISSDDILHFSNSLPEKVRDEKFLISFTITAKSVEIAETIINTLNMLIQIASMSEPGFKDVCDVFIQELNDHNQIQVFLVPQDRQIKELTSFLSSYDLSHLNLDSNSTISLQTGLSPFDLLKDDFETLAKKAARINFNISTKIKFAMISKFMMKYFKENSESGSELDSLKLITSILCFLRMIPRIDSKINLNDEELITFMKDFGEIFPEYSFENLQGFVDLQVLTYLRSMFDQAKSNFGKDALIFKSALNGIDWSNEIAVCLVLKPISFMASVSFTSKSIQDVINEFFNEN